MGIKEKIYRKYVVAQNKLNALKGEEPLLETENADWYFLKTHTKDDLNNMLYRAEAAYDELVEKMRVENYYNTEEGALEKENLIKRIDELKSERRTLVKTVTQNVDTFIKEWLGDDWGCSNIGTSSTEIGLVEKKGEYNSFYFGHNFTIYYNDWFRTNRFEMNYGCMGCFDISGNDEAGNLRCKYLLGMGTFASDKQRLSVLHGYLKDFVDKFNKIDREMDVLTHNLNHPFDKRKVA